MTMSIEEIKKNLESLRLHGMSSTLQSRTMQANQGEQSFLEVISCLVMDELDFRSSRLIERRFTASGLDERKIVSDFDWSF
ncbi:MAG: ATP-binding protein, partial [bacterium]|nr:ATP-binding protein [bacterium]